MPDPIWIDDEPSLVELARRLQTAGRIGIDTEFLRERTFFPRLCLLQVAADREIWCVDTLALRLEPLGPLLEAASVSKLAHAARQDLEALRYAAGRIAAPVFDTQVAAACAGLKPQIGYADLVRTLLGVSLDKAHTRTDWSKRPLSREQLSYAADDVRYLEEVAAMLEERVRALGREDWVREDCAALADPRLYESDPDSAWERLGAIARLEPGARVRAKAIAAWRERTAQQRNLPRAWILPDAAIYEVAEAAPVDAGELARLRSMPAPYSAKFAEGLLAALRDAAAAGVADLEPARLARPTDAERAAIERMARVLDSRAAELGVSAEVLATRGQIKALATGTQAIGALAGWRRAVIGERLLAVLE